MRSPVCLREHQFLYVDSSAQSSSRLGTVQQDKMISRISTTVADWLAKQDAISDEDRDLFAYATYSLLFGLAPFLIAAALGVAFGMRLESLLLILPFMLIRKFSGGYHLKSPGVCIVLSTSLIALSLVAVKVVINTGCLLLLTGAVLLSTLSLCLCSPIDSESRKLSEKETKLFRMIARVVSVATLAVYLALLLISRTNVAASIGVGILIAALLQIPCLLGGLR